MACAVTSGFLIAAALCSCESWIFRSLSWIYGYGSGLETIPAYLALDSHDRNFLLWSPFVAGGIDRLAFWGNADPISIEPLLFKLLPVCLANSLHRSLQYFVAVFFSARGSARKNSAWTGAGARFSFWCTGGCKSNHGALLTIARVPGISLAHAPEIWPNFPVSRDHNTGLVHQEKTPDVPGEKFEFVTTYARPRI
ncbi:hypothetical protein [Bradyrhizobium liaoningense]